MHLALKVTRKERVKVRMRHKTRFIFMHPSYVLYCCAMTIYGNSTDAHKIAQSTQGRLQADARRWPTSGARDHSIFKHKNKLSQSLSLRLIRTNCTLCPQLTAVTDSQLCVDLAHSHFPSHADYISSPPMNFEAPSPVVDPDTSKSREGTLAPNSSCVCILVERSI